MIVSVSRRCDIPRFHFDWFMERLGEGFVEVRNPFNRGQVRRVALTPEEADFFVFWTRDPRPILAQAEYLEARGFRFYVMTTLNNYPALLEPNMPPPGETAAALRGLAERLGPERVIWRYDPVLLSSVSGGAFHRRSFGALAAALGGAVRRVIVSLYDEYGGAKRRMAALEQKGGFRLYPLYAAAQDPPPVPTAPGSAALPEVRELLEDLAGIAQAQGMTMQSCAEGEDFSALGIKPGACIDGDLMVRLGGSGAAIRDKNQRPHCLCVQSVDIGWYESCPGACVYCYARR